MFTHSGKRDDDGAVLVVVSSGGEGGGAAGLDNFADAEYPTSFSLGTSLDVKKESVRILVCRLGRRCSTKTVAGYCNL